MKNYTITVNGTAYQVTVEDAATPVARGAAARAAAAVAPAPVAAPAPAQAAGGVSITAPMPGKILAVKAPAGTAVKRGQVVLLLEAMKMENEIVAPQDGTVASVNVAVGDMVEPGATLATLN